MSDRELREPAERDEPCTAPWPGRTIRQCAFPAGHDCHWDGAGNAWVTVAPDYPHEIAAAEQRGYDRAMAEKPKVTLDAVFGYELGMNDGAAEQLAACVAALRTSVASLEWMRANPRRNRTREEYADYLESLPLVTTLEVGS